MTVYVDKQRNKFRNMIMCHMLADSEEELHAFALKIGMKREWFQPVSTPHYDLSLQMRALALKNGAVEIDARKTVEIIKKYREAKQ